MQKLTTNYLLFLEYDGSDFSGWQKQPGCRTVQGELEKALRRLLGYPVKLTAAGRTDAGVHAVGQAANLRISGRQKPIRLRNSLNALLPADIAVSSVKSVPADFNARYAAKGKVYQYRIWNKPFRSVWNGNAWHIIEPLNIDDMRQAAARCTGRRDFSAFYASGGTQENTVVNLRSVRIYRKDGLILFAFEADRFLYKMIRTIVGTFVEVGKGRLKPARLTEIIKSGDRRLAGQTAPAHGLFLRKIEF